MRIGLSWVYHPCLTVGFETLFSQWNIKLIMTKLGVGPDFFHLNLFDGIPKYVINLLTWKFAPGAKISHFSRCQRFHGHLPIAFRDLIPKNWHKFIKLKYHKKIVFMNFSRFIYVENRSDFTSGHFRISHNRYYWHNCQMTKLGKGWQN